jgi:hypothetical protein
MLCLAALQQQVTSQHTAAPSDDYDNWSLERLLEEVYGAEGKLVFVPGLSPSAPRRWSHTTSTSEHRACVSISADSSSAACLAMNCNSWFVGGRRTDLIKFLRERDQRARDEAARLLAASAGPAMPARRKKRDATPGGYRATRPR